MVKPNAPADGAVDLQRLVDERKQTIQRQQETIQAQQETIEKMERN